MRYFLIVCSAVFSLSFCHKFYVSVCQIDFNSKTNSLEITLKIFTDDLENTLEAQGTGKLYLGSERESEDADRFIFNYIKTNFNLKLENRQVQLNYLGKEVELDVTWCFIEVLDVEKITNITVTNTILIEQFEDQTNIVHVKVENNQKSMLLHKARVTDRLEF